MSWHWQGLVCALRLASVAHFGICHYVEMGFYSSNLG